MKKFFNGLIVTILLVVIIGGLGYVGYSYFFANQNGMAGMPGMTPNQTTNTGKPDQNSGMANMPNNTAPQQNPNDIIALETVKTVLANKTNVDAAVNKINEAMGYMTLDPYMPSDGKINQDAGTGATSGMSGGMDMGKTPPAQTTPTNGQELPKTQVNGGDTTINIYPSQGNSQNTTPAPTPPMVMNNMGTAYDQNKMESLHNGIYKMAVGMQLLDQLKSDLVIQAENASMNTQNMFQYYTRHYTRAVQNNNKITQSLNYINEAATLINTNPYVSDNGLVYDKDRMKQIHQGVYKMAQGVASLNKMSDDFTNQAIFFANSAQQVYNNELNKANMASMQTPKTGLFSNLFGNLSTASIVNILLVVFVVVFILGILGFIFSLLKTPSQKVD